MAYKAQRLARAIVTPMTLVLLAVVVIAGYFVVERFADGLAAVTNINQGYPWGVWVVIDLVIGTALGCGGFAMALLVYVFNRGEYHRLVRPALLGGLFGYTLAGLAVLVDLGRYWQAYNLFLPWYANPSSVMLEVGVCVLLYVLVLWAEFSPAILERTRWSGLKRFVSRWMFLFIALGVLLPAMHQSSLGSLLLVLGSQMSPLWFTVWLPVLFVVSALAMGYAIVVFESTLASEGFDLPSEHRLLSKLSIVVGAIMFVWIALRIGDLVQRDALGHAFAGDLKATMFWIEMLLAAFAVVVFLLPFGRSSRRLTFLGAASLLLSGSLYRLDAYLVGYEPVGNWRYFPSVSELMVTFGVIALEILLFLIFIKALPVLTNIGPRAAKG